MGQFTYLVINALVFAGPFAWSFERRIHYFDSWKYLVPGLLATAAMFIAWDHWFTIAGVWSFNPDYVLGVEVFSLPLEEIFFFFTIPFACLFIYRIIEEFSLPAKGAQWSWPVTMGWSGMLLLAIVSFRPALYTSMALGVSLVATALAVLLLTRQQLARFWLTYLIHLVPFGIVNGLLTFLPVVSYNNEHNLGVRLGTIPVEDLFYSYALLMLNVIWFEKCRSSKYNK